MFRLSAVQVSEQPGMSVARTVTLRCGKVRHHCTVESFLLTRCDPWTVVRPLRATTTASSGANSREIGKLRFPRSRVQLG